MRPQEAWALIKQVQGMVEEGWHPHYTSTYCIHDLHEDCRLTCKHCEKVCLCQCHLGGPPDDHDTVGRSLGHAPLLIDGSEQKPGRKSHDATSARASVQVTFCKDDGCMYAAGHDGPHDITWQAEHNDRRDDA